MNVRNFLALAGVAAAMLLGSSSALAQQPPDRQGGGRGNFDPEQMRQRMMERYREQLEIKGDDEWKIIEERVVKVTEARRDAGSGRGGFGFMRPQRQGGADGAAADTGRGNRGGGPGGPGGAQLPEADELQKAIEAKASADDIKAKLAKYREARKVKQANLVKAQDELRKVLSVRQEAAAVLMGLLD